MFFVCALIRRLFVHTIINFCDELSAGQRRFLANLAVFCKAGTFLANQSEQTSGIRSRNPRADLGVVTSLHAELAHPQLIGRTRPPCQPRANPILRHQEGSGPVTRASASAFVFPDR